MFTADQIYGPAIQLPTGTVGAPTEVVSNGGAAWSWKSLASVHNPLTWFAGILLVTVGAAGVAGSARLGPAAVHGSVGKTETDD